MTRRAEPPYGEPSGPPLTVAAVARRLGVAPATLRTWDRRYQLGPTGHSAGAHRRYSPRDLVRLQTMRALILAGVAPADAARAAIEETDGAEPAGERSPVEPAPGTAAAGEPAPERVVGAPGPDDTGTSWPGRWASSADDLPAVPPRVSETDVEAMVGDVSRALDEATLYEATPEEGTPEEGAIAARPGGPGGRVLAVPGASARLRGLARAAMALDARTCMTTLRAALAEDGVIATWERLLRPVLVAIGRRWAVTGQGVEVEHLLSEAAIGALRQATGSVPDPVNARPVLLSCAPEELHSLPLYALAAALAERRISTRVLGAAVPLQATTAAIRRVGPAAVFVWSQHPATGAPATLAGLPVTRPPVAVVAGGPGWPVGHLPERVAYAADLRAAVQLVAAAVGGEPAEGDGSG